MLVLSRRSSERIVIELGNGVEIIVNVLDLRRGKVRIGIEAPANIRIYRGEVRDRILNRDVGESA